MTEWVITCDAASYDVEGAFTNLRKVDWKQNNNIEAGDIVYIYVGKPVSAIRYMCRANKVDLAKPDIDDSEYILNASFEEPGDRYMELELLKSFNDANWNLEKIMKNGLRQVRGSSRVTEELHNYIESILGKEKQTSKTKSRAQRITILMQAQGRPVTARELMNIMYPGNKNESQVADELRYMMQQNKVIRRGIPYQYYYELPDKQKRNYFYVMQNKTYLEELSGGYIWAPQRNDIDEEGAHHWKRMQEVKKGDIILHGFKQQVVAVSVAKTDCYAASKPDELVDKWNKDGWKVDLDYFCFDNPIKPKAIWEELKLIQPDKYAPFNKNGNGNQGYLFAANQTICQCILDNISKNGTPGAGSVDHSPEREKQKKTIRKYEKLADDELINAVEATPENELPQKDNYVPIPEERKEPVTDGESYSYPRNKMTALKALKRANYECEIDESHPSFIRKTNGTKYTEPHHLIPMSEQDRYENSLDIQANIVSLCSNCHNELHYGQNPGPLLRKLYDARKDELTAAGILISLSELLKLYL